MAIEIKNLSKSYGNLKALQNVNLKINQGEFFGLLGPNGAGKSTLIGVLGGLVNKDLGTVTVLGKDIIDDYKDTKRSLGIVPQEISLDYYFTVRDTLKIQAGYFGIKVSDQKVDELLDALGLADKADERPRRLSGGMKRRLLIAKALIHDPEIIVLDEPTAGVDVELRNTLWDYVRELNRRGKTIILTTHYLEEAEALCDRIAIMDHGQVITVGTKDELINSIDKKIVTIKSTDNLESLSERLGKNRSKLDIERGELAVEVKKEDINQLLKDIVSSELRVDDLNIDSAKLEDVFIKLTNFGGEEN